MTANLQSHHRKSNFDEQLQHVCMTDDASGSLHGLDLKGAKACARPQRRRAFQ